MFYADKPITNVEDDIFNHAEFSSQLAKSILSYTRIDNLTIGLCGKWGEGKTSILNMAIEELKKLEEGKPEEESPIIMLFNPWNYSDSTQLISQFFQTLQLKIGMYKNRKKLNALGAAIQEYVEILEFPLFAAGISENVTVTKKLVQFFTNQLMEKTKEMTDLKQRKEQVIKELSKQKRKIIVIIDDIDRLNNHQIRLIFQLVNSLAGFPNMIYLLSFDREVVVRALGEEQQYSGEEYLEKVIQVLFELPVIDKTAIDASFKKMFYDIVKEENVNNDYWVNTFECISPFLRSMRNVKRIINTFEFKYGLIKEEVNCLDLLVLTTLQICVPELYSWIYNNKTILVNHSHDNRQPSFKDGKEKRDMYLEQLAEIYSENPTHALQILQWLFPKVATETGNANYIIEKTSELDYRQRIASGKFFERYFALSLGRNEVGRKHVLESIKVYSEQELKKYFAELENRGQLLSYLNELKVCIGEIPKERCEVVFRLVVEILGRGNNYEQNINSEIMYSFQGCLYKILEENDNKRTSNFELFVSVIENLKIEQLPIVCKIMERVEGHYGRLDDVGKSRCLYLTEKELKQIENQLIKKIEELTKEDCLFDYKNISYVKKIWEHLNSTSWNNYDQLMKNNPINIPKYIANYIHEYGIKNWNFNEVTLVQYINIDDAYQKILTLKTMESFASLNSYFKRVAVAFYCWYNDAKKTNYNISEAKIDLTISEWEKELAGKQ